MPSGAARQLANRTADLAGEEAAQNERGQRVDNQPYGRVFETLGVSLYEQDHPYFWPVIGWIEDLNRADLDDLKRFFLRWYGPNNAVLTVGGAVEPMATLELVNKYFGPIPSGPEVEDLSPQPGTLEADRYVTMEDNIHLPAIAMLIPTVHYRHPDEAPLDAAAKILGQGKSSLLYQRLVQTGRAVSAYVSHSCRELACEMAFVVIQNPASGETLAEMEAAVRNTLHEFAERGVNEDDLQKFIAGFESQQIFGMQSVAGKVSNLAFSEVFSGDPRLATADIERYAAVTREDVVRTFRKYIEDRPAVILSVVPNGNPELAARPQNFDYRSMAGEGLDEAMIGLLNDPQTSGGLLVAAPPDRIEALRAIEEALYQTQNESRQDPLNFPIRLNDKLAGVMLSAAIGDHPPTASAVAVRDELFGRFIEAQRQGRVA